MCVWLTIDKSYSGLKKDIYIANLYFSPETSTHVEDDPFAILQGDIADLPNDCYILLCGDFNARTNVLSDYEYITLNGTDGPLADLLPNDLVNDISVKEYLISRNILRRVSQDTGRVNNYGTQLLDLCKCSNLCILNGRIGSDRGIGKFTRTDTTGNSVVDYVVATPKLSDFINHFMVHSKFPESDHVPITFAIKLNKSRYDVNKPHHTLNVWYPHYKYKWSVADLSHIGDALMDRTSLYHKAKFQDTIRNLGTANEVALKFSEYFSQVCQRVCSLKTANSKPRSGPAWFDTECKLKRTEAIRAGEKANSDEDRALLSIKCCEYRSLKQRKKRQYHTACTNNIATAYNVDRTLMWSLLSKYSSNTISRDDMPGGDEFISHYELFSNPIEREYFDNDYMKKVREFLKQYDQNYNPYSKPRDIELDIFNSNFGLDEVNHAIESLRNNKSAGIDCIPAEFIKHNKDIVARDICTVLNHILEREDFPEIWSEGIRSSVFKAGDKLDTNNYRGITVLSVFAKIFEIIVQRRFDYVNEAFSRTDKYNGGFLKGCRTADNLFILQCLVERQLNLNQNLFVVFVDFKQAFDIMNRDILFYKIIKSGLHGMLLNTLRSLYSKTSFRVKHSGKLSDSILQQMGVNQGGNASPTIFREYLADLSDYLPKHTGVCISDAEILVHLLWADDLILVSTQAKDSQKQLDSLFKFCSKNWSIVNEIKTKAVVFGKHREVTLVFNEQPIEQVKSFKYVGNVTKAISVLSRDMFGENYTHLCDKAKKSIFALQSKRRKIGCLPPQCMFHLFDSIVRPILTYGSDVWGVNKAGGEAVDKVLLWFARIVLRVKATTSNIITLGECGLVPPSVTCAINVILYFTRIREFPDSSIVKSLFIEQKRFHDLGFTNWYGKVWELAESYGIKLDRSYDKIAVKDIITRSFRNKWLTEKSNLEKNPILRTYDKI